jgi:hypothetical protein
MVAGDDLVGRDEILGRILGRGAEAAVLHDIHGELGSGRTSLLRRLQADLAPSAPLIDLERYDPGHGGRPGPQVSVGATQASYVRWVALLADIARAILQPDDVAAVLAMDRRARGSHVLAGRTTSVAASLAELDRPFGPREHVQAWNDAAASVSATFVERWLARSPRVPLLLDNAERVLDQDLGRWLVNLLDDLTRGTGSHAEGMRVVLARSAAPTGVVDLHPWTVPLPQERVEVHALTALQGQQVVDFIYQFRGGRSPDLHTARRLEEITSGHPATLRLVCELLYGPAAPPLAQVDELVRNLPARGRQQAAILVEEVLTRSGRQDLLRAVQVAAVPRRFNADLLRTLLAADGFEGDAVRLFDTLPGLSFVERQDEEGTVLRSYEYVRLSILARIASTEPDRLDRLSECAAEYFRRLLAKNHPDEAGVDRAYGSWYLYELGSWQSDVGEWLYHSGRITSPGQQRRFLLETSRLFLDAFFWWGNYVHFDFCDKLVADLGQLVQLHDRPPGSTSEAGSLSARSWPELVRLRRAFVDILENYPPRSVKAHSADWGVVRSALVDIKDVCGLTNLARPTQRQQHVKALVHLFLAHTWRYGSWDSGDGDPERADLEYRRADAALATVPKDEWIRAWVALERSELALARLRSETSSPGDPDLRHVRSLWEKAAAIVQPVEDEGEGDDEDVVVIATEDDEDDELPAEDDDPDHELMSNLHRLRAEVLTLTSDRVRAAESYRRAVLHAYVFHVVGGPPDEYTLQLYVDVRARALRFMLACWTAGVRGPDLDRLAAGLRVGPSGTGGDGAPAGDALESLVVDALAGAPDALAQALWPPGPDIDDLGKDGSYARDVRAVREALTESGILEDLHPFDLPG